MANISVNGVKGEDSSWSEPHDWQSRPVCVLGGGVLGRRIAACFVAAGYHVRIRDPSEASGKQAVEYIKQNISVFTRLTGRKAGTYEALTNLSAAVKDCWLVFEAVPEIRTLKENTFAELEAHTPSDCILGSNSSSYKSGDLIGKISDETKKRVLSTHFMMPPEALIIELMTCGHTAKGVFPFLADRCKEAGLHPCIALRESTGFIFNRIWAAIKREVLSVLAEGVATPETIDSMWIEQYVNKRKGPCALMDEVGLDTVEHIEQHYIQDRHLPAYHLEWLQDNYISQGKLGLKTSDTGGLYPVPTPGSRTKLLLLNLGLAEPLEGKSLHEIQQSGSILEYTVGDSNWVPKEILAHLPMPDGIDVASSTDRMYWTNMGGPKDNDGSIQSAKLDGSDIQTIVKPGEVHTPKQMVIDQEANKIYYCDREGLRVWRCNLDGSEQETIYETGDWNLEPEKSRDQTLWPVGITISRKLNKFFWTQKGDSKAGEGRIFSASLSTLPDSTPSNRSDVEVVMQGLPECIDLEFDDEDGVLYWTDRGEIPLGNTVNKKHLVGTPPPAEKALGRQIIAQGLGEGIGLRLDKLNRCLYVADLGGHMWKCSIDGGLKEKLCEGPTHAYTGVTFVRV